MDPGQGFWIRIHTGKVHLGTLNLRAPSRLLTPYYRPLQAWVAAASSIIFFTSRWAIVGLTDQWVQDRITQ